MGIRYYKLFDLLNRKGMKKSDLRSVISSATVAKLSKGEYISGEAIEKICLFLNCQPGDIMEVVTIEDHLADTMKIISVTSDLPEAPGDISITETYVESSPSHMDIAEADETGNTKRQIIGEEYK